MRTHYFYYYYCYYYYYSQWVHLNGIESCEEMWPGMLNSRNAVSHNVLLPHEDYYYCYYYYYYDYDYYYQYHHYHHYSQWVHLNGVESCEEMWPGMLYSRNAVTHNVLLPHEDRDGVNPGVKC